MKAFIVYNYQLIKRFYVKYERLLMPTALVVGFLVDYFTFANIQINITFIILFVYWALTGFAIIFIHIYDSDMFNFSASSRIFLSLKYIRLFIPLIIQFTFGALLSASLIFYWFFGAFSVSWPLVVIIVLMMIFNDTFRQYFAKPLVQTSVYFFVTISLFSLALPFLFNSLSIWLFIVATGASLIIFLPSIYYLSFFAKHFHSQKRQLFISIFIIAGIMNLLYFTDIIPPIPLALREAGIYHSIQPSNGSYIIHGEYENFLQTAIFGQILHIKQGSKVYSYTAIFAPAKLSTTIVHHWQYYDEGQKKWISKDKLNFTITGGRKEGYKGYSWQSNLTPGRWRISVENLRGQILGRVRFTVKIVQTPVNLQEVLR